MKAFRASGPRVEANQTGRLQLDRAQGPASIRLGFTDQRLTACGGRALWSHFLCQKQFCRELASALPHHPTRPNAYVPTDLARGCLGGILARADQLSRVAWRRRDAAVAEMLGIQAVPSQSTRSRCFRVFTRGSCDRLARLPPWATGALPSSRHPRKGDTLDLDSWALLHENGHQERATVGDTRPGLKPYHRPLIAALAEPKLVAHYALRRGDTVGVNEAAEFGR